MDKKGLGVWGAWVESPHIYQYPAVTPPISDVRSGSPGRPRNAGYRTESIKPMSKKNQPSRRGFALVELLAVVLILSVLAAVAVPLYVNTRKNSAARACTANIASLVAAESAYKTRFGSYVAGTNWSNAYTAPSTAGNAPSGGLIGAPEGLGAAPNCPLGHSYTISEDSTSGTLTIECSGKDVHASDTGSPAATWVKTLLKGGEDKTNPL